jgi:hypothetical protein
MSNRQKVVLWAGALLLLLASLGVFSPSGPHTPQTTKSASHSTASSAVDNRKLTFSTKGAPPEELNADGEKPTSKTFTEFDEQMKRIEKEKKQAVRRSHE